MKTIKITDDYFIRITNQNYTVCKLGTRSSEKGATKEIFMFPTYHTTFESAIENIQKRLIRDGLVQNDVTSLKDAVNKIQSINDDLILKIQTDLKDVIKENYDNVALDTNTEEDDDLDEENVKIEEES